MVKVGINIKKKFTFCVGDQDPGCLQDPNRKFCTADPIQDPTPFRMLLQKNTNINFLLQLSATIKTLPFCWHYFLNKALSVGDVAIL
jgi:hypothetical protein